MTGRSTPADVSTVTVVMPVLDEGARIDARLREHAEAAWAHEVIVVDGGSADDTVARARAWPGARVLAAPRGRGPQMNAGAAVATGEVVLFQHADVALPADALRRIREALADPTVVAGAFRVRTVADDGPNRLGPFLRLADLRSHRTRLPYGDQALFVRRAAFEAVGGFPPQPIMEDVELARRLWRRGRIVTVPSEVRVSGRRFLSRPLRTVLAMRALPWLYRAGVSPDRLARLYGSPR